MFASLLATQLGWGSNTAEKGVNSTPAAHSRTPETTVRYRAARQIMIDYRATHFSFVAYLLSEQLTKRWTVALALHSRMDGGAR